MVGSEIWKSKIQNRVANFSDAKQLITSNNKNINIILKIVYYPLYKRITQVLIRNNKIQGQH